MSGRTHFRVRCRETVSANRQAAYYKTPPSSVQVPDSPASSSSAAASPASTSQKKPEIVGDAQSSKLAESAPLPPKPAVGVTIHQLSRVFDTGITAIDRLDLTIDPGEFVAILGPSGCGKSTLLRIVAGLDRPTSGSATTGNVANPSIAYVFQDAHLLPWRNVLDNAALPLELLGMPKTERRKLAQAALEHVGLGDFLRQYPAQLSGGMRMRVSLARALVNRPSLLLLDEPFAALDEITRQSLDEQLRQLWQDLRMTVLFVTHSTTEAAFLANRAIVLTPRPARMIEDFSLNLPEKRDADLRGSLPFAEATHRIYSALQRGTDAGTEAK